MKEKIRWGIIGPGRIARAFAEGLVHTSNGKLTAIASRSNERGKKFAEEWEVPNSFDSYQKLAQSSVVDAIYIATPHSEHHDATLLCLKNGKHVLCEKPLAVNANQVLSMTQTARAENQILMEGMWSRFPPLMRKVKDMVDSGMLGEIFSLQADFGFLPKDSNPKNRLFNPDLAGGSLLDIGIYPLSFASMILGTPQRLTALASIAKTNVDEQTSCILKYENGAHAILHSSLCCETGQEAFIAGKDGNLRIHKQCWKPQIMTVRKHLSKKEEKIEMPFIGNGFNYEAEHFGNLIKEERTESDIMPLAESLSIAKTMDQIREHCEVRYPFEM